MAPELNHLPCHPTQAEERDLDDDDDDDAPCASDTHHQSFQLVSTSERAGGDISYSVQNQQQAQTLSVEPEAGAETKAGEDQETSGQVTKQQQVANGGSRRGGSLLRPTSAQLQQNEPQPRKPNLSMSGTPAHNLAPAAAAVAARAAACGAAAAGNGEAGTGLASGAVAGPGREDAGGATPSGEVSSSRVQQQQQQQQLVEPPSDMLAELGRMAAELRSNVKDVAIKLEGVIGSGSFGTVRRGGQGHSADRSMTACGGGEVCAKQYKGPAAGCISWTSRSRSRPRNTLDIWPPCRCTRALGRACRWPSRRWCSRPPRTAAAGRCRRPRYASPSAIRTSS